LPARILVVDDDPLTCELICEIFSSAGLDASFLTSSIEADGRLKREKYHAVFLDMRMSAPDGAELARPVRASRVNASTVIVMITGEQDRTVMRRAFEAGVEFFLFKPVERDKLLTDGREAVEKAVELKPDVTVVDISMPELDGVEAVRQIREAVPDNKVLVLTMHESDQMVRRALDAGAHGFILKSDLTDSLPKAVRAVADGKRFLTPKVSQMVLEGFLKTRSEQRQGERRSTRTTPRETEIVRLLAEGKSNKEIAAQLGITVRTVETHHRAKIMLKLGFHSLTELIHYAMRHGMFSAQADR